MTMILAAQAAGAEAISTPTGLDVALFDVVLEPDEGIARFRYLVPALADGAVTYPEISSDFIWLCEVMALPALSANGWMAERVIITLADREVPFGEIDALAVQFIDGFEVRGTTCLWEDF